MLFPWAKKSQAPQVDQRNVRLKWILDYWVKSVGQQFEAAAVLLGSHKEEAAGKALMCEIGLLHLYLIDQEIRRQYPHDPYLTSFLASIVELIQEMNQTHLLRQQMFDFAAIRFSAYDTATATVSLHTDNPLSHNQYTDLYFQALSAQFWAFLVADLTRGGRAFLYPGPVTASFPDTTRTQEEQAQELVLLLQVRDVLISTALPVYYAARLWAQDTLVYDKPVEELKQLALEGYAQAEHFLQRQTAGIALLQRLAWWQSHYQQQTQFTLPPEDQLIYDDILPGISYLRLQIASGSAGKPLRRFALAAYDDVMGLSAVDPKTGLLMLLTLGEIITLLQTGYPYQHAPSIPPQWEGVLLQTSPVSKWRLCAGTRRLIHRYYTDQGQTPLIGWLEDNQAMGMLVITPQLEASEAVLEFSVSSNLMTAEVQEGNGAQFDLWDIGQDSQLIRMAVDTVPTDLSPWQEHIDKNTLYFRSSGNFLYGYAGMPFELFQMTTDPMEGRPLREIALGCYDNSRCLAVLDQEQPDRMSWYLTITDLAHLLQTGQLTPPKDPAYQEMKGTFDSTFGPRPIDSLVLPRASQGDIYWIITHFGGSGTGCVMRSTSGQTILLLDSTGLTGDAVKAVQARLRYSIPPDVLTLMAPLPKETQFSFYTR